MSLTILAAALLARLSRRPPGLKGFDEALRAGGGLAARSDAGLHTVAIDQIVGSVGRAACLRADFLPRTGPAITARHRRVAEALLTGLALPPLELYALTVVQPDRPANGRCVEYYVLDGHHRVAMARRLGQLYLEAHVVEYRLTTPTTAPTPALAGPPRAPAPTASDGRQRPASALGQRWPWRRRLADASGFRIQDSGFRKPGEGQAVQPRHASAAPASY